jgi:predicted PurR-regulated permease PerM
VFEVTGRDSSKFWWIIGIIVFLLVVYYLAPAIIPFALGLILAYILNPLVKGMKRLGFPRWFSITLMFIIGFILVFLCVGLLIPVLETQLWVLLNNLPRMLAWVQEKTAINMDITSLSQALIKHVQANGDIVKNLWLVLSSSTFLLIETAINILLIPIVAIYTLRDWDKMKENMAGLFPRSHREKIMQMLSDCGEVLAAFFRGQLLVMIALGIIYSIGLTIIGLDLSLVIGIGAGLLSVVPYLGFIIGFIVSIIDVIVKYHSWLYIFYVCIVFAIGHIAENYILLPWLVGDRIGLHPVAVIFSVIAGGVLFDFVGVLLALPVAAVIMVLLRHLHQHYIHTDYYKYPGRDKEL